MESYDKNFYSNIRQRISGSSAQAYAVDRKEEDSMVEDLQRFRTAAKELYLRSILHPECQIAKVPSRMPVDSAIAALKYNFTITPNATGRFCLVIDPFFNSGFLYQDATVNGLGAGVLTPIAFPQDALIIDQWRLVSSGVILKYYGNFNQMSGLFVASTTSNVSAAVATTYLTFSNVEDLTNKQILRCIDGCKLVYAPMDEKATEFQNVASYVAGTHPCRWQYLFVIVGELFPNAGFIRCDFFRNIEYTSTPTFREYISQTKDLPNDTFVPRVNETVTVAPKDFTGKTNKNNTTWTDEVKEYANEMMRSTLLGVGGAMRNLNPFAFDATQKQFNVMKESGMLGSWNVK